MWIVAAALSALFAGITSILAKCGMKGTNSDLVTALRTVVVLVFSWVMVFLVNFGQALPPIPPKSLLFLLLSGVATGASWLCYFKALSCGSVNKVAPVDKSSTVITVLLAIFFFGETERLAVKLCATAALAVGIFLMIDPKQEEKKAEGNKWLLFASLSALFAAASTLLAKVGVENVESNLATAIRTGVVLVMAWLIVFLKGEQSEIKKLKGKEILFIFLSGLATGASWLCYYYAIQKGVVSVVVPIDKLSILFTVAFSFFVFGEKLSIRAVIGLCIMVASTLVMAIFG